MFQDPEIVISPKSYIFTDKNLINGNYSYRLKQIDIDGAYEYSSEIEIELNAVPEEYQLLQNYPNPFNPSTKIEYNLPFNSQVKVKIYNMIGELEVSLVDELKPAGFYNLTWNAENRASGIYLYTLEASSVDGNEGFITFRKMILIK